MMILLPFYFIATRKFEIHKPRVKLIFSAYALFNFLFLAPLNMLVGGNINYLMQPPQVMEWAGPYYRLVVVTGLSIASLLFSQLYLGLVPAIVKCLCATRQKVA